MLLLAMDRAPAPSVRSYDADGRLHVASSNISKANVCPYLGREVPGADKLNLDPDRVYYFLRDPEELAKAASTFNNLPVLSEHIPVHAWGEDSHQSDLVVGSTGTDAVFSYPYLQNSMVIWARPSIDGIETNKKRELSSAYRWRADMTPGNFDGVDYDGIMRDIIGNHVALVFEGRAGSDVFVGDEKPMAINSRRALMVAGGLSGLIRPLLAQDAKFDIAAALSGVSHATLAKTGAVDKLATKVFGLVQPHLAEDAALTVDTVKTVIETANGLALDGKDEIAEDEDVAEDEDIAEDEDDLAEDEEPDAPAMDAATVKRMIHAAAEKARNGALAEATAIRTAEREVQPIVGDLVAMDSAVAVYRAGLKALDVDLTDLPESAYASTFRAVAKIHGRTPTIANDSNATITATGRKAFDTRFPNRVKLIRG